MLAKLWKKVLLAICIVACLFNIMNKFVNKSSLEASLKNVKGDSILSILKEEEKEKSDTIDGVIPPETTNNTETSNEEFQTQNKENNIQEENINKENSKESTIVIY